MLTPVLVFEALLFLCGFQLCRYIWKLFKQRWRYQKLIRDLKMRETAPAHPIWGHAFLFPLDERKRLDAIVDFMLASANSDGPADLAPFWLGPFTCMLMMSSPEYVKACVANADYKDNFSYDWLIPWIGDGLLTSGGPKWHRHRRLLTPAFHFEILKPYLDIFADSADILLNKLSASEGKPMEIFKPVGLFALDSLLKCSFSYESNCQLQGENEYINAVYELSEIINLRALKIQYLNEMIFKLSPPGRRFRKLCHIVHEKSRSTIRKRRREIEEGGEGFKGRKGKYLDFLDILLAARDEDGKGMDEEEIREEVDTFMFEGHDTTGCAIPWLMYNLAKHPEYQQKCRDEIQQLFDQKEDDQLSWDDLCNLPYLTMCIKESLRLYPPVMSIMRKLVKDVTLPNETVVPKGTNVTCSIIGLHYNPVIWPNPKEFNPERFTPENVKNRHTHAFLPFSAGPRNCIGQHFALNEIKVVMCKILHRFYIDVDPDRSPIWIQRLVIRTWDGMYLRFTPVEQ
ncbi:cytochrome P450 4A7-like [Amphiura filiformis]|uniref:cytochrome P450 4A7-like n=1 Tax=Amphiura filiformis TaxID=82378 RepID=UPI003B210F84